MSNFKTIYPPTKFAKENDLSAQLKHFYSEIKEIRRAQFAYQQNPTPETLRHLIEEVQDSIHSGETLCRIAEAKLGVDVAAIQLGIVEKNRGRRYYAGDGYSAPPLMADQGLNQEGLSVRCPKEGYSIPLEQCKQCGHYLGTYRENEKIKVDCDCEVIRDEY